MYAQEEEKSSTYPRSAVLTRRQLLRGAAVLAATTVVAACSPAAAPQTPAPTQAPAPAKPAETAKPAAPAATTAPAVTSPITLSVHVPDNSFAGASLAPLDKAVAEFESKNANIKIKYTNTTVAQHRDKMAAQAIAGQLEDVIHSVVQWTVEFAHNGWIADLTPRLGELDKADWPEAAWICSSYKGQIYGIPHRRDNFAFFYNKDHFAEAGITKFPDTVDELTEAAKKLTKDGRYGIGLVGADHAQTTTQFISFMLMFGNTVFSKDFTKSVANEPSAVAAAKYYADLVNVHKAAQPTAVTDNRGDAEKLFMAGKASIQCNGPWLIPTFAKQVPDLKYGVGLMPSVAGQPKLSLISGWDWCMSAKTKYPEQAWQLIKFLNEPQNQAAMTNTFPARLSAFKDPRFSDPALQPWLESAKISYPNPATPAFPQTGLAIQRVVPQILSGKMTPEAGMAEVHKEAERLLKEMA